jgi:hypothetical protein
MDKIILAHYINVGNVSPQKVAEIMSELSKSLAGQEDVLHYIYPITQGDTRVDCINPKLVTGEEYKYAKEVLSFNESLVKTIISKNMNDFNFGMQKIR